MLTIISWNLQTMQKKERKKKDSDTVAQRLRTHHKATAINTFFSRGVTVRLIKEPIVRLGFKAGHGGTMRDDHK